MSIIDSYITGSLSPTTIAWNFIYGVGSVHYALKVANTFIMLSAFTGNIVLLTLMVSAVVLDVKTLTSKLSLVIFLTVNIIAPS